MKSNSLDGFTILRYAKVFRSGGGLEQYLEDLDRILLKKNNVKILRMYIEKETEFRKTITREIGQGSLIEIPMPIDAKAINCKSKKQTINYSKILFFNKLFLKYIFYNPIFYNPIFYNTCGRVFSKKKFFTKGIYNVRNAGKIIKEIHQKYKVDLLVMHNIGTFDSAEIIQEVKKLKIPYIFINHYANDRFNNFSHRELLHDAAGIAGVSNVGVPSWLKGRYCNLSDGIDTELFNPLKARSVKIETDFPLIIYPARITRVKGQIDLVKAYAKLKREGIRAKIVFAGKTYSSEYEEEVIRLAKAKDIINDVLFVGQLNTEELRDWYGASSVMAFPTYHQEGLGRITVEAQAMKVPPVAYIIGGTPEGIQHGKTGFLVRKGDLHTFTERIKELLTDEKKRKTMGEEGRKFVEKNFSLEVLADRHEKFYLRVLDDARNKEGQQ